MTGGHIERASIASISKAPTLRRGCVSFLFLDLLLGLFLRRSFGCLPFFLRFCCPGSPFCLHIHDRAPAVCRAVQQHPVAGVNRAVRGLRQTRSLQCMMRPARASLGTVMSHPYNHSVWRITEKRLGSNYRVTGGSGTISVAHAKSRSRSMNSGASGGRALISAHASSSRVCAELVRAESMR